MIDDVADEGFMRECLRLAADAEAAGEVPVGALVVRDGHIIGRGCNQPIGAHDPTAHAEIVALREAGASQRNYRLVGADLYVTLEPCAMCVGAVVQARLRRVVFACTDPKAGALGGLIDLPSLTAFNHRFEIRSGILQAEARTLLQNFFRTRRTATDGA